MKDYTLRSPEKVIINLNLAGFASRFAAQIIDYFIMFFILLALLMGIGVIFAFIDIPDSAAFIADNPLIAIPIILIFQFLLLNGYFVIFELAWNGQTPGKRLMKLRVVRDGGAPVTFASVLIRNLMRIVDLLPTAYAIGIITILLSKKNQRLGDMAAGTLVIRDEADNVPIAMNLELKELPWTGKARLYVHQISESEYGTLKQFLIRRPGMNPDEAAGIIEKLTTFFALKLGVETEEIEDKVEFLEQVAALYQQK